MKKFIIFFFIFLSGCKTLGDIRQNKPDMIFESKKTVDRISECILYGWENKKDIFGVPYGAFIQPFHDGKTVYIDGNVSVADVFIDKHGVTLISLYLPKYDIWSPTVKNCI